MLFSNSSLTSTKIKSTNSSFLPSNKSTNSDELISVISCDIEFDNNYKEIALNYYEVNDSNELKRTISELKFLNNDK